MHWDIYLGQILRKMAHVDGFYRALKNPAEAQRQKLNKIIKANAESQFGKDHRFEQISNYKDYQNRVPASDYEYFRPYVERLAQGERNQLTVEDPLMFATTSGTTASPKWLPVTPQHLRDYTHAFHVHNYSIIKDIPKVATGKFLTIASNDEESRTISGIPCGAISGLLARKQSPIIKRHFALPYEICKVKDVDAKYYLMLRASLMQDVTAVVGCNPSSLLLLGDQLKKYTHELIGDIANGTLSKKFDLNHVLPKDAQGCFDKYLKPDPKRARHLESLLERNGSLRPELIWPNLSVISCWKGGPMSFYLDKLNDLYGPVPVRDLGYMASEGRGTIPIHDEGSSGILAVTSHFFEFVEEDEIEKENPRFLTVEDLKLNGRYYIFFTTSAGIYRYNINDLMEVTGFVGNTPLIRFVRKGLGVSSITGEKLTEEQVLVALNQSVQLAQLEGLVHFTVEVKLSSPPHYVCYVEMAENNVIGPEKHLEFEQIFDQCLIAQNPEYKDKRLGLRLASPRLELLKPGTYTRLRQQRVKEGAPETQVKIPLLSAPQSFSQRLELLQR